MKIKRFLSPDGEGSGGSGGQTTQTTTQTTQTTSGNDDDRSAAFKAELKKYQGDALRMAEKNFDRVYSLRQRSQVAEAKLPTDDQIVIKKSDAELLKRYQALGTLAELTDRGDQLVTLRKFEMVSKAARVADMNPNVLSKLLPGEAKLEIGEAKDEDGQAKQVVSVIQEGKDTILLATYAETNWTDFLPALKAKGGDEQGGAQWIQQGSSTRGDAGNGMNPILAKRLEVAAERAKEKPII